MPDLHFCLLVDFEGGELLAEGVMTFGEAELLVNAFFEGRNVQVYTPGDISPSPERDCCHICGC